MVNLKHYLFAGVLFAVISNAIPEDSFLSKFHQNRYKIKDVIMDLKWFNPDIFYDYRVETFKYNRSCSAANGTFTSKVSFDGKKQEMVNQAYKFVSNEYREFPMHFQVNLWKAVNSNLGGMKCIFDCGNIRQEPFYFQKNVTYHFCNIKIDATRFPPLVPAGRYMVEFTGMVNDKIYYILRSYAEVYYEIPIKP